MIRSILAAITLVFMGTFCSATVNVVVSTYDGIVVAADSRVTSQDGEKTRIASDYGEKIVRVGSHSLVAFSGAAYLFDDESHLRSIGSIINQYKSKSEISDTTWADPAQFAQGLDTLLATLYNAHLRNVLRGKLAIVICGFDRENERRLYELRYPHVEKVKPDTIRVSGELDTLTQTPQSFVNGQNDVWFRIIKGYDPKLDDHQWFREYEVINVDSLDSTKVDTTVQRDTLNFRDLRYEIRYDIMNLQDAIDYALFVARATIEAQRFNQSSIQGVGGAIDIAVVTSNGFRWIQCKRLHGEGSPELIEH